MIKEFDFYSGYEGEPEFSVIQKSSIGVVKITIKMWIGFFDSLIEPIMPNSNGEWEGIILYYHTNINWFDNSPWNNEEKILFVQQLESFDNHHLDIQTQNILEILIMVFKDSIDSNDEIYFEYD